MSTTITWNGTTGDWNSDDNWSNGVVPNASDITVVVPQGTVTVDGDDTYALNSLTLASSGAVLEVEGTLNFSGLADNAIVIEAGVLALEQTGTLLGAPDVTIGANGTLDLSAVTQAAEIIGGLSDDGTVILGNTVLVIGVDGADSTLSGTVETGTTEQGGLIDKTGTGSVTLDDVVMNPGTNDSGLYIDAGSLLESSGSSSLFYLAVGEGTGDTATATLSSGTLNIGGSSKGALQIGDYGGSGTFDQTGGTLTVLDGSVNIGNQGGSGDSLICAGTLAFEGGVFDIGRNQTAYAAGTGTLAISGGLVDIASGQLVLGTQYNPSLPGSSGTIIQTGGELRIESAENFYLNGQDGSQGRYDLDGGTLEVGGASLEPGGGAYTFNLGGGTIAVLGTMLSTGVDATLAAGTTSALNLDGLGAVFTGTVSGSGDLDVQGVGSASFAALDTTGTVTLGGNTLALNG